MLWLDVLYTQVELVSIFQKVFNVVEYVINRRGRKVIVHVDNFGFKVSKLTGGNLAVVELKVLENLKDITIKLSGGMVPLHGNQVLVVNGCDNLLNKGLFNIANFVKKHEGLQYGLSRLFQLGHVPR